MLFVSSCEQWRDLDFFHGGRHRWPLLIRGGGGGHKFSFVLFGLHLV